MDFLVDYAVLRVPIPVVLPIRKSVSITRTIFTASLRLHSRLAIEPLSNAGATSRMSGTPSGHLNPHPVADAEGLAWEPKRVMYDHKRLQYLGFRL